MTTANIFAARKFPSYREAYETALALGREGKIDNHKVQMCAEGTIVIVRVGEQALFLK